jgi:hypothetical protein
MVIHEMFMPDGDHQGREGQQMLQVAAGLLQGQDVRLICSQTKGSSPWRRQKKMFACVVNMTQKK